MTVESLQKVFLERLAQLYSAQRQLSEAYPRMAEACCSYKVLDLLNEQAQQAQRSVQEIENIFRALDAQPVRGKAPEVRACVSAANRLIAEEMDLELIDAGLVEIVQQLQRHVLAYGGGAEELAKVLGVKSVPVTVQALNGQQREKTPKIEAMAALTPRTAVAV